MIVIKIKTWKDWKQDFLKWVASTSAQHLQGVRRLYGGFAKSGSLQSNKRHLR